MQASQHATPRTGVRSQVSQTRHAPRPTASEGKREFFGGSILRRYLLDVQREKKPENQRMISLKMAAGPSINLKGRHAWTFCLKQTISQ